MLEPRCNGEKSALRTKSQIASISRGKNEKKKLPLLESRNEAIFIPIFISKCGPLTFTANQVGGQRNGNIALCPHLIDLSREIMKRLCIVVMLRA